ncbi:cob(I)yrinic acid a,c-diamide adenosyltransferase [Sulfitobacter sp. D35]|uniref:cob(I)yrinic acid a,c-diamide adenosyltransferase n=1 Tax=Sulfitobacter sp. D35 TaxID=3083252 RepID=UPI00296EA95C|nr:cob(I)yrinic acid a,c-diamide adenosyltransferase [Sulfitobacter sp. D35]MDW4498229.1 cob(I)yrinic acid a,c-diamide adenosyltransferase [Sulfitobacter sp. D35]
MSTAEQHKEDRQRKQAEKAAKRAELRDPDKGLVLVHTGAGKGKTSSAIGVIVRALGWKQSVGVVQFIKGKWVTGERRFFEDLGGVTWHTMGEGFTWDTQDRDRDIAAAEAAFAKAEDMLMSGDYDLVVLDEINIALRYDYLPVDRVLAALEARDKRTAVILTGRDAKPEIIEHADLVTEMGEVRHPYKAGIKAQRGVDY